MSLESSPQGAIARDARYEYYMVQIPSNFSAREGQVQGQEIAAYVQEWANKLAAQGWEFYRIDTMGMTVAPGCLTVLLGGGQSYMQYSIMTFRRQRASDETKK